VPLFLSSHVLKQQRALEVHKGTATINAVTASPEKLVTAMETAKYFQANLVVLLVSSELTPSDTDGRLRLASNVLEMAENVGLPQENLYLDPVMACRPDPSSWYLGSGLPDIDTILDSIHLIGELTANRLKTILAISNSSVCLATGKRSAFHCHFLPMLHDAGLNAVIMNCHDKRLMAVAEELAIKLAA